MNAFQNEKEEYGEKLYYQILKELLKVGKKANSKQNLSVR